MRLSSRPVSLLALLLAWALPLSAFAAELTVHFFDVGQGDSALIVSPAGKTVLLDGGPPEAGEKLAQRLKQLLTAPIDLMVMTHAHADHLGGLQQALQAVGARLFMDPGFDHPSPLYTELLRTLEQKGVTLRVAEAGRNIDLGGGANLKLLAPSKPFFNGTRSDVNANVIVARLIYGRTAFYLAADSERETERRIAAGADELSADVYKVAHHASRYSSSDELLAKVKPRFAVVSVGAGNEYGHPSREIIDRLETLGATVYRTDLDGEIVVRSDGDAISVTTERGGPAIGARPQGAATRAVAATRPPRAANRPAKPKPTVAASQPAPAPAVAPPAPPPTVAIAQPPATAVQGSFVGSRNSDVFHKPGCTWAGRIKPENLVTYGTREAAVAAGRRPAKDCNP